MKLEASQINEYKENGYLIVDSLFTEEEVQWLKKGINAISNTPMPNSIREENGDIRSVFAPHHFREEFSWLYKQDRIVTPTKQLSNAFLLFNLYWYK